MTRIFSASAIALIASLSAANAATEIQWWHAMGGELGAKLEEIARNFNESQTDYVIKPSYKGNYVETMTAAIAAFPAASNLSAPPASATYFGADCSGGSGLKFAGLPSHQPK